MLLENRCRICVKCDLMYVWFYAHVSTLELDIWLPPFWWCLVWHRANLNVRQTNEIKDLHTKVFSPSIFRALSVFDFVRATYLKPWHYVFLYVETFRISSVFKPLTRGHLVRLHMENTVNCDRSGDKDLAFLQSLNNACFISHALWH